MRQVLLATTALLATAGIAMAQDKLPGIVEDVVDVVDEGPSVALSGSAEIGVFDAGDDSELQFHTDIDVSFTMSGVADNGLSFGASIDLDESDTDGTLATAVDGDENLTGSDIEDLELGGSPAFDNSLQGGESIFIANGFGTLTMGDTDGAYDFALSEAIIGSAINDDHEHAGYDGNGGLDGTYDGQIARYEFTFAGFSLALSGEIDDDGEGDPVLGIGARYSAEVFGTSFDLGIGYQTVSGINIFDDDDDDDDSPEIYGVSVGTTLPFGVEAIANYSNANRPEVDANTLAADFDEHYGIALGYTFGQFTVAGNYARKTFDDGVITFADGADTDIDDSVDGFGIVVNYDLGGGIEAQFGYGHSNNRGELAEETVLDDLGVAQGTGEFGQGDGDDNDSYSIGLSMAF